MKHVANLPIALIFCAFLISSCSNSGEKSANLSAVKEQISAKETPLNPQLSEKIGNWLDKGVECYGIVVTTFQDGRTIGKSVKSKVMSIASDRIKMKALENVSLMESIGCDKMGLSYGDTWWEKDGDLFQTREEADQYLKDKGWLVK